MLEWNEEEENRETANPSKMKMADRFMTAMFSPHEYHNLLGISVGKMICYFLCLFLLITTIQVVIPSIGAIAGMGGLKKIITERIPVFELKNGTLWMEEPIEVKSEASGVYLLVDTKVQEFTEKDVSVSDTYVESILISRSNIIIRNAVSGMSDFSRNYKFSDFGEILLTRDHLIECIPIYYIALALGFLGVYIGIGIKYMISALFYATFIFFMTRMLTLNRSYGETYKVAMYAKTTGSIVEAITYCIGNPLLMLAGNTFHFFITMMIMNRVYIRRVKL